MTDLISRSAVHIVINSRVFDTEYPSEFDELERLIDEIPAIDAVPVVHRDFASVLTVKNVDEWHRRIILDEGEKSKNCAVYYQESDFDLAPVVHARWIGGKYYNDVYGYEKTCTACKKEYVVGFDYLYCPYCGAKMDGEADG